MGVPYHIIVEEQEFDAYASVIDPKKVLVLDKAFQRAYKAKDPKGDAIGMGKGSGPARNFAGADSVARGAAWHWVMDDNINGFYRLNKNLKVPVGTGATFRAVEDFCLRYQNVSMAGPNYFMFASRPGPRWPRSLASTRPARARPPSARCSGIPC